MAVSESLHGPAKAWVTQVPVVGLHTEAELQLTTPPHVTGVPMQVPPWHTSFVVQALLSEQGVPSAALAQVCEGLPLTQALRLPKARSIAKMLLWEGRISIGSTTRLRWALDALKHYPPWLRFSRFRRF